MKYGQHGTAKHLFCGDSVKFLVTEDFLSRLQVRVTFKDGSDTTMSVSRFESMFEVVL